MRLGDPEGSGMSIRKAIKIMKDLHQDQKLSLIFKPLKVGKTVTKVPMIKTDNVPGKPEWWIS